MIYSQAPVREPLIALRVVFLDRDGVINVDHGYVHKIADFELTPNCAAALSLLCQAGFRLAVVTNQSGIAAGKYSLADVEDLHDHLRGVLARDGIALDAIAICPHAREAGCNCRKPRTGMGAQIQAQLGHPINYAQSWTIGDKPSDIAFGSALGTRTALLRSRYWSKRQNSSQPNLIAATLFEATLRIVDAAANTLE